jgi:hypothetical protein
VLNFSPSPMEETGRSLEPNKTGGSRERGRNGEHADPIYIIWEMVATILALFLGSSKIIKIINYLLIKIKCHTLLYLISRMTDKKTVDESALLAQSGEDVEVPEEVEKSLLMETEEEGALHVHAIPNMDIDKVGAELEDLQVKDKAPEPNPKKKRKCGSMRKRLKKQREMLEKAESGGGIPAATTTGTKLTVPIAVPSTSSGNGIPGYVSFPSPNTIKAGNPSGVFTPREEKGRSGWNTRVPKRTRGSPDTDENVRQPAKRQLTFRDAAEKALKLVVGYSNASSGKVSATDYAVIQDELRRAIDELDGSTQLKIAGVHVIRGNLVISCHDEMTKLWVEGEIVKMSGNKFRVSDWVDVGPQLKVRVWIRETASPLPSILFSRISKQNGNLDTSNWSIVHSEKSGSGYFLILKMDVASAEVIKPPARFYYYTDLLAFRVDEKKKALHLDEAKVGLPSEGGQ